MTEERIHFYSPHYWECLCNLPQGIHRTSVVKCIKCDLAQGEGTKVNILDLLDYNMDPYPINCAEVISVAKVAMDIISDVASRNGRHASYITDELLHKNQYVKWPTQGGDSYRMIEMVTDGIGVFIAKAMNRVRSLMAGTITAMTIYKFTNERDDGNYIFIGVAVNGIWLMTDGMTDFSGAGGRAYQDLSAVIKLWAWLYNTDIEISQKSNEDYARLCREIHHMQSEEY